MPRRCWHPRLPGLALALAMAACSTPEERFAEHMERAERFRAEERWTDAFLEYQNALKLEPKNAEANHRFADTLRHKSYFSEAAYFYREASRLDPERLDAAMAEARLVASSDPRRARYVVREALTQHPDEAIVHRTDSYVSLMRGNTRRALASARHAIRLDDGDWESWVQLGTVHQGRIRERQLQRKRPDEDMFLAAIGAFTRVDKLKGGFVRAQLERARVLGTWPGHRAEAVQAYRQALALARSRADVLDQKVAANALDEFARALGNDELRRWALKQLIAVSPDEYDAWDRLGRLGGGEETYLELLAKRPEDPEAHRLYASYLMREGRTDDAIAHLRESIDGLESPLLWEQLFRIELNKNRFSDARATFVAMTDEFPDDPVTRRTEVRLALAEKRHDDAIEMLRPLVPELDDFETQRLLAVAEFRSGNLREAAAAADRALAIAPSPAPDVVRLQARIYHDSEHWQESLEGFQVIAGRGLPLTRLERIMRVRALYETGRAELGREELEKLLASEPGWTDATVEYWTREGNADPERAYELLLAAFRRTPNHPEVIEALTTADVDAGRAREALARLDLVIRQHRVMPRSLLVRAQLLARMSEFDRAEADVLRAFEAVPDLNGAVDLLFAIYHAQGRLDEARRSFEEAEAAGVLHSGARVLLARMYVEKGDVAKAREMLEKVLSDQPGSARAKNDLAFLLAKEGADLDRAARLAHEAASRMGKNPGAADTVGYVYYRQGLHEAALQQFRSALELADARPAVAAAPDLHYHLGLALRALGRDEEAAAAFEKALLPGMDFVGSEDARRQLESIRHTEAAAPSPS